MKFKRGERVLVLGNSFGISIVNVHWPLKGYIHQETRCNNPESAFHFLEHYHVVIDDQKARRELERQGYYSPSRWMFPVNLLRRDKFCPVCNQAIETYSDKVLIA